MHVRCVGSGPATVLLIAGFGDGGDNWGSIEGPLAQDARVCSSARFGTGTSDPPSTVQTFRSHAADLHQALVSIGETGPYVVVGHSFGGAEAVTFASMFGDEVSGLLLLDASPTTWPDTVCTVPDDGSDTARSYQQACAANADTASNPEHLDVHAAFADVATITSLGDLPLIVLTATSRTVPGLDPTEAANLNQAWDDGQQRWASLSTQGSVVTVDDTSHYIQLDQPGAVIDQVERLLGTSTTRTPTLTPTDPTTSSPTD